VLIVSGQMRNIVAIADNTHLTVDNVYTSASGAATAITAPTVPLDVAGAALISSTLGVTGLSTLTGGISLPAAANIALATTTGTKIGTATSQLLGFYNATPVDQPATVADPTAD